MKKWLLLVPLLSLLCWAQSGPNPDQNCATWGATGTACANAGPFTSGTQVFLPDIRGTITNQFEVLVSGTTPATLTMTVVGCMRGGTCSGTIASSSGTSSQIVTPTSANLNIYDKYGVTVSWTGGDATTRFIVNRTGTVARLQSTTGGTTINPTNNVIPVRSNGTTFIDSHLTDNGTIVSSSEDLTAPNGTVCTAPAYGFTSNANFGLAFNANNTNQLIICGPSGGASAAYAFSASNGFTAASNFAGVLWANAANVAGAVTVDTSLNRAAAGIVSAGLTNSGTDTTGSFAATSFQARGTTFTASGCANSTLVGGGSAGTYTSVTAGSCTVTITMGNSATAPHGWVCDAHDLTTVADANNVTMGTSTTTTANLVEGTVAANDVIAFKCTGY